MLRFVSELRGVTVWRVIFSVLVAMWMAAAFLAASCTPAHAEVTASGAIGADAWSVPSSQVRYLPNYSTPKEWQPVSVWARGTVQYSDSTDWGQLTLTAQGRTSQIDGGRVDRLDADLRVLPGLGVRAGVLPYRISWCRTYDARSPWLSEPDAFCRYSGLNEVAQGAFGAQAYASTLAGNWVVDGMAGVYRPRVDGQNDKLGPYKSVGPTVMHDAHGLSVNALHLPSGIQARAAWLRTKQNQDSSAGSYQRRLEYDTFYAALEGNLTQRVDLRASVSQYSGDQTNPALPYSWVGRSTTLEAIYRPASGHSVALGLSEYVNRTTYSKGPNGQIVRVPAASVAWRFDLPDQWFGVVQATHSKDDATTRQGVNTLSAGTAYGVRLARTF